MSLQLPPDFDDRVKAYMATGRYASEEELFDDALCALDAITARQDELRREIRDRVSQSGKGDSAPLDRGAFQAEARRRISEQS
jgi:Arc/MetJ-type ribon-helix-helix transcriptional regulator